MYTRTNFPKCLKVYNIIYLLLLPANTIEFDSNAQYLSFKKDVSLTWVVTIQQIRKTYYQICVQQYKF